MLSVTPLRYPSGTEIFIPINQPIVFSATDFVALPTPGTWTVTFDFGFGGPVVLSSAGPTSHTQTFRDVYAFTLRVLAEYSGMRLRYAWRVQVGCAASDIHPGAFDYVAAAHATFGLPFGGRELAMPLPQSSSSGSSGAASTGSGPQPGPIDPPRLQQGLEVLCRRFQQAYAYGFGRLPFPSGTDRAIHIHTMLESLVFGSSTPLQADLAAVEYQWGEALRNPDRVDAMDIVRQAIETIGSLYPDLSELGRVNLVGGDVLVAGPHSINLIDVVAWQMYATGAVDDSILLGVLPLSEWSQHQGNFDRNIPQVDWPTVWRWEVVQAAVQCVAAMYGTMGILNLDTANFFVTADPVTHACSLRVFDSARGFWAHAAVAPTGAAGHIELTDMNSDGAQVAQLGSGYVAARAAGMVDLQATGVPHIFDLGFVQASFDGSAFAKAPTITTTAGGMRPYGQADGLAVQRTTGADGASTLTAQSTRLGVATLAVPAIPMPDGKDAWASLRPHALLAVLGGQMAPVQRRG